MTTDEHKARHVELHHALDELLADWFEQTDARPSQSTVLELITWSHQQTINPTVSKNYTGPPPRKIKWLEWWRGWRKRREENRRFLSHGPISTNGHLCCTCSTPVRNWFDISCATARLTRIND